MDNKLTPEDREHIQNQIAEYKQQQLVSASEHSVSVPITPDGQQANQALEEAIKEQSIPNKREYKKLLSFGEFQQIYDSFGEKIYEKALTYIAKK